MGECVGFADCPCKRCRLDRVRVTTQHASHDTFNIMCGVCRTKRNESYRVPVTPLVWRRVAWRSA